MVTTPDLSGLVKGRPPIALPLDRDVYWALSRVERNVGLRVAAADGMRVFANQISGVIHPPAPSPWPEAICARITEDVGIGGEPDRG